MKKVWDTIAKDLWIVLLDILAVNAAYLLALLIRFYVNFTFRPTVHYLLGDWGRFAPFYTVLCLAVFFAFRLYGGMWRFAGINDMNRIIGANLVTCVIQIVGTALFIRRMPITYYVIGAILQFLFVATIRFGYRILLVEKKKIASRNVPAIPTLIIGAGETGRKILKHMEDSAFKPVAILDEANAGKSLDGVPVVGGQLEDAVKKYNIREIVIADSHMGKDERKAVRDLADKMEIELLDYTGYLVNLGGRIPLAALLEISRGAVRITVDGEIKEYESGEAALKDISDRYDVVSVEDLKLELKKPAQTAYVGFEAWAKQYKEETGNDVSFF